MTRPTVDVVLELDPAVRALVASAENAPFRRRASLALLELGDRLGIPAEPVLVVGQQTSSRAVRLSIDGTYVPYPPELLTRAWLSVAPSNVAAAPFRAPVEDSDFPDDWLTEMPEDRYPPPLVTAFIERAVIAIAGQRPSLLFGRSQAKAYADVARIRTRDAPLLRALLDAGVSLADHERVREAVADAGTGRPGEEAVEVARSRLVRNRIDVHVAPPYLTDLGRMLEVDAEDEGERAALALGASLTAFIGSYFADDRGLDIPAIEVHPAPHLRRREIQVVVAGRAAIPVRGLRPGDVLVGATMDQVTALGVSARDTWNPTWEQPGAVASETDAEKLAAYMTWSPVQFVGLATTGEIARSAELLVTSDAVQYRLGRLAYRRPRLARLIGKSHAVAQRLTPKLRTLARENVSIRNLDAILSEMVLRENGADDVEAARLVVAPSIVQRYAFGGTLVAYLLGPDLSAAARGLPGAVDGAAGEAIRSAVWRELSYLPPHVRRPVILTDGETRAPLRSVLAAELPNVAILTFAEVDPDLNVQPVARISLERAS